MKKKDGGTVTGVVGKAVQASVEALGIEYGNPTQRKHLDIYLTGADIERIAEGGKSPKIERGIKKAVKDLENGNFEVWYSFCEVLQRGSDFGAVAQVVFVGEQG